MAPKRKQKLDTKVKAEKLESSEVKTELEAVSGQIEKKMKKQKLKKPKEDRGIVLIRNIPHGFYEEQLRTYFQQFGKVTRVRVARSIKTTRSKGFAYVEFEHPEVAEIAAETMNNYMMFKKVIKTVYIPPSEQTYNYFSSGIVKAENEEGKEVLTSKYIEKKKKIQESFNRLLDDEDLQKRQKKQVKQIQKLKKKLEKHNIDFNVDAILPPSLKVRLEAPVKATKVDKEKPKKVPKKEGGVKKVKKEKAISEKKLIKAAKETLQKKVDHVKIVKNPVAKTKLKTTKKQK